MANKYNLSPEFKASQGAIMNSTPEGRARAKIISKMGNEANKVNAAARKTFKQIFEEILPFKAVAVDELAAMIVETYDVSNAAAISLAMIKRAMQGDVAAAVFVRDTVGESPKQQLSLETDKNFEVNISVVE